MAYSLGVIGCGKMAYALIKGIMGASRDQVSELYCNDINSERTELFQREFGANVVSTSELIKKSSVVILAVKPQQVKPILDLNKGTWSENHLLISIAAGISTAELEKSVPDEMAVVRVMPNTPCLVGAGVSVIAGGKNAEDKDVKMVGGLLSSMGIARILDEKYMDAVTAVSGSGPAYAYLVIEAIINAGINIGLDAVTARELVLGTFKGSIELIEQSKEHPAVLREQVSSPAGTTIAGIKELEKNGIRTAFFDAITAAYERSIELGRLK